jgi:hypothetical protein
MSMAAILAAPTLTIHKDWSEISGECLINCGEGKEDLRRYAKTLTKFITFIVRSVGSLRQVLMWRLWMVMGAA